MLVPSERMPWGHLPARAGAHYFMSDSERGGCCSAGKLWERLRDVVAALASEIINLTNLKQVHGRLQSNLCTQEAAMTDMLKKAVLAIDGCKEVRTTCANPLSPPPCPECAASVHLWMGPCQQRRKPPLTCQCQAERGVEMSICNFGRCLGCACRGLQAAE